MKGSWPGSSLPFFCLIYSNWEEGFLMTELLNLRGSSFQISLCIKIPRWACYKWVLRISRSSIKKTDVKTRLWLFHRLWGDAKVGVPQESHFESHSLYDLITPPQYFFLKKRWQVHEESLRKSTILLISKYELLLD